jgi:NAD(P)-dependent dehydrogenase (short-subunit alcohol dehydrogenase family)
MRPLKELLDLRGRVALITGGGGHLGGAICEALAELGTSVVVLDAVAEACHGTAGKIQERFGVDTMPLVVDLSNSQKLQQVWPNIKERFGRLDILVNCAALVGTTALKGWATPFLEQDADTWRLALEINLTSIFVLIQSCAPALAASGRGSIINISSIYGMVGPDLRLYDQTAMGNPAAYAASKGGLLQFTRWLSTVLAPRIRVNAISIGGVWRGQPEEFQRRYLDRTPLGRMAVEEDIKGAAAYLATDLSAYVTGHNLVVDGGWTAW